MPDGLALPAIAFAAAGLVALALVWPQGQGAPSPAPFGHPVAAVPAPVVQALKNKAAVGAETLKHPFSILRGPEPSPQPAQRPANSPR